VKGFRHFLPAELINLPHKMAVFMREVSETDDDSISAPGLLHIFTNLYASSEAHPVKDSAPVSTLISSALSWLLVLTA